MLHIDRQYQSINDKGSVTNCYIYWAEVNTYFSFKGKTRNEILLATAIVEIQNKSGQYIPCRALLDSASQSHFITESCVQRLRLSRTQTHAQIQGISSVNTETYHSVSIHLRSRHTAWHKTLNCAILSHITGTTPSTKLDKSWVMKSLIKQETLIYSLELTYSTICFNQTERPVLTITQFYKTQFLTGQSQVELQLPLHSMTLSIHFCYEKTTVCSII